MRLFASLWYRSRAVLVALGTVSFVASACLQAEGFVGWEVALLMLGGVIVALPALLSLGGDLT